MENKDQIDLKIVLTAIIGILGMIWGIAKIASVNQRIGAEDWWTYMFMAFGVIGSGLIIIAAYQAIKSDK